MVSHGQKRGSFGDMVQSIGQKFGRARKAIGQKIGKHKKDYEQLKAGAVKVASGAVETAYQVGKKTEGAVKTLSRDEMAQAATTGTGAMLGGAVGAAAAQSAIQVAKGVDKNSHRISGGVGQARKRLKTMGGAAPAA